MSIIVQYFDNKIHDSVLDHVVIHHSFADGLIKAFKQSLEDRDSFMKHCRFLFGHNI